MTDKNRFAIINLWDLHELLSELLQIKFALLAANLPCRNFDN